MLRLQQVLSGVVHEPHVDPRTGLESTVERLIPTNRPAALRGVLEDVDGQAVIWARFKQDIDTLAGMFDGLNDSDRRAEATRRRWRYAIYDGRVGNVAERERRVDAFSKGEIDLFLGNPAAGGTGVDGLQEQCSLGIYYSNSFNREHRWQSEGRIARRGQKERCTFLDLVVPGTVDELFLNAIASTEELANMVLRNPSMILGGLT
jgi:SNF2 family DNA or RNA helicase